jgi:E3 ubiquitin-protein ligase DOA10
MQKNIVILAVVLTACMQGMEKDNSNFWNITVGKTKINLIKGEEINFEMSGPKIQINEFFHVSYERPKPNFKRYQATILSDCCYHLEAVNVVVGEALKDLKLCYEEVFTKAVQEKKKYIALPILSIGSYKTQFTNNRDLEDKAAQCTIQTVLTFLRDNFESFDCIELCVAENSEFSICKKLLETFKTMPRTKTVYWEK